jgi:hypothetical protein
MTTWRIDIRQLKRLKWAGGTAWIARHLVGALEGVGVVAAELTGGRELYVVVDHRLVVLIDEACSGDAKPPLPHNIGHWLSTAPGMVYVESAEPVLGARLRLEA